VDDSNTEAVVVCRYALKDGAIAEFFAGHDQVELKDDEGGAPEAARLALFKSLRDRVPTLYTTQFWAEDPNDPLNTKVVKSSTVKELLSCGFINAQRGLDGTGSRSTDILAKVLENLFASASLPTADGKQRDIAEGLTKAVEEIQGTIDEDFRNQLTRLMPTIEDFGYPGLDGHELRTETRLDVKRLLSDHTKIQYSGYSGVHLPEAYNGLGFRNLLFILLQIVGFYRNYRAQEHAVGLHLIFIEEPEAHLHPQMQEVFIRHLTSVAKKLCTDDSKDASWPVQFVVSTHSPHVANEASFEAIRYFTVTSRDNSIGVRRTDIKDLSTGLASQDPNHMAFLHQYLTLTRCDLFFADKAILIEGTTERLMVPQIARKLDAANKGLKLTNQYITIMEVGGAYAHIFFPLLDFLNIRTLIVTDLDPVKAVKKNGKICWSACTVRESQRTSNACLNSWFKTNDTNDTEEEMELVGEDDFDESSGADDEDGTPESVAPASLIHYIKPSELITKKNKDKIKGNRRIAYQIPEVESGPCGRTFEDAFMLANAAKFNITGATAEDQAIAAGKKAKKAEGNEALLDQNFSLVVQATAAIEVIVDADDTSEGDTGDAASASFVK
jgi:putative ATP-dependent endonuclease of the OLD family